MSNELVKKVVANYIEAESNGDIVVKYIPPPKFKPPRRRPGIKNKSNRSDYMKEYMQDYRKDKGKDYQKVPTPIKKLRSEQRKRLKEKFNLKGASF